MSAPDRILLERNGKKTIYKNCKEEIFHKYTCHCFIDEKINTPKVIEFIRADIHQSAIKERDEKIKELEAALNEAVNFAFCLYAPDEMGVEAVSKAHSKAKGIGTLAYLAGLGKIARGEK